MDIRDTANSQVIWNIMAKKKSFIEKESRIEVAENSRAAQVAEIEAKQSVAIREQEAMEQVGQRSAKKDQTVGIATQQAEQEIKMQEKITAEKSMAIAQVNDVRAAEIRRDVQVVQAEQEKRTAVIRAEGTKAQTVTLAEGKLAEAKLNAEGVEAEGKAKGSAEQAILMAPVNSQIALAKEIGANEGYQTYLIQVRTVEKDETVGIEQAKALTRADVKVIANAGAPMEGVKSVMDLFTSKGGTNIGAALEAFVQTPTGAALLKQITGSKEKPKREDGK